MEGRTSIVIDMIKSFAFAGVELTMTAFNKEGKVSPPQVGTPPQVVPPSPLKGLVLVLFEDSLCLRTTSLQRGRGAKKHEL